MKYVISILTTILFSCAQKGGNNSVAHPNTNCSHTSQVKREITEGMSLYRDTAYTKCYQTFDEFTMSGKGQVTRSPFVYVRKWNDSILVYSSNKNDSVRLYIKQNSNIWYSHMEYDMWKKRDYVQTKDRLSRPARTYDRFFYNDTIIEIETTFMRRQQYQRLFIKGRKNLFVVNHVMNLKCCDDVSEFRRIVNRILLSKKEEVLQYSLKATNEKFFYEGRIGGNSYSYDKKAYGLWGIQPGIEEAFLYEGIDIREYSNNLEDFQRINPDHIYDVVDEMPQYPSGFNGLQDFIRENRVTSLLANVTKPYRVVLEAVVEKDGNITNIKIIKSIDLLHDEDAIRIIRKMPKWTPAKQNGKIVRCKILIPISYKKSSIMGRDF